MTTANVGTPGGAKGGAWGKPDSHVIKGGAVNEKTGKAAEGTSKGRGSNGTG